MPSEQTFDDWFAAEAARSAASLEERTLNDRGLLSPEQPAGRHWQVTVTDLGGGAVEATLLRLEEPLRKRKKQQVDAEASPPENAGATGVGVDAEQAVDALILRRDMAEHDLLRSGMRARRMVRQRIMSMGADRMLTLTKRGGFATVDEAWQAWGRFARMAKRVYPPRRNSDGTWTPGFRAVAVPELHTGKGGVPGGNYGTWHLHVAVDRFYWANTLRRLWHRALTGQRVRHILRGADAPGNVDIRAASRRNGKGGSGQWQRERLARYLAKYMTKDYSDVALVGFRKGQRRYACTGAIAAPPKVTLYHPCGDDVLLRLARWVARIAGRQEWSVWEVPDTGGNALVISTY